MEQIPQKKDIKTPILQVRNLVKTYKSGDIETKVLKSINLDIFKAEFLGIIGRSGAGKSTFLYQISLLDRPTEGEIFFRGKEVSTLDERSKTLIRLNHFGYIFQDYALIPELTAEENIMLPLLMKGESDGVACMSARKALDQVGLEGKYSNRPNQLSGGEQQRVSIARAVAHNPSVLFADEPTANLDSQSAEKVLNVLRELNKEGQTIVMVTHDVEYTKSCDRIVQLGDGKIVKITTPHGIEGESFMKI